MNKSVVIFTPLARRSPNDCIKLQKEKRLSPKIRVRRQYNVIKIRDFNSTCNICSQQNCVKISASQICCAQHTISSITHKCTHDIYKLNRPHSILLCTYNSEEIKSSTSRYNYKKRFRSCLIHAEKLIFFKIKFLYQLFKKC